MIRTEKSVRVLQAVAAIAGLAVLLWSFGLPSHLFVEAANLTDVSDTLTDSAPSVVSNHTITFVTPDGVDAAENIVITFPAASFDLSNIDAGDIDFATGTDALIQDGAASGGTWGVATTSTTITITSGTGVVAANATVTIEVGTNATFGGNGNGQIVNPTVASYEIEITAGNVDTGATRVVIIDDVEVTASVNTIFTFAVAGVIGGQSVNGTTTTGSTTATTIPFGALTANVSSTTAQDLFVTTNASQGFVVTVQVDGNLLSSTGADIDTFNNGSDTNIPAGWVPPSSTLGDEDTYGHWGVTSDDAVTGRASEFGSDQWIAASTSPRVVFAHTGPADGTSSGTGTTRVGYTIEISSLQEAGDDYAATLTYIATPTF
jgi:hypothetical protein